MPTKPETVPAVRVESETMIDIEDLEVHYELRGGALARLFGRDTGTVRAVDGVNLALRAGRGARPGRGVGQRQDDARARAAGTRARDRAGPSATTGRRGVVDVATAKNRELRKLRTELQMVFQDPHASLNPSMDIETAVGHPLLIHGIASGDELRSRVGGGARAGRAGAGRAVHVEVPLRPVRRAEAARRASPAR